MLNPRKYNIPQILRLMLTCYSDEPPTPSPEDNNFLGPRMLFSKLPDPLNRYQFFKMNATYSRYEIDILSVFDTDKGPMLPPEY